MRKKRVALIAQHRPLHDARHVRAPRYFFRANMNLQAIAVGVFNRRPVNHAIEPGPQRIRHAHRAGLACGVHRKPGQGGAFQFLAGQPDSASFGMRARIVFAQDRIGRAHQALARACVDNERAERHGARRLHGSRGKFVNLPHAPFVDRASALPCGSGQCHAAI